MRQQSLFGEIPEILDSMNDSSEFDEVFSSSFDEEALYHLKNILQANETPVLRYGPLKRHSAFVFHLGDLMTLGYMKKVKDYHYVVTGDIKFKMHNNSDIVLGKGHKFELIGFE